ncbi:adenylate/guanylate cyclase domain-containing protein [Labrys sp. KNU-23]|uniref:adenylate/guanylate cyclase domain-containing protein n=1 Tax=Labrys sp. KNU-23 TaxID=2789216 RepID=UPI0011F08B6A|nr:adenylate/guanylate cyclase domain-containing protein [Labrys sp. KNU-23]QEN87713.1 adenylate/guanylate cyclase domain-containing protein [Labrys sp. KNU-23]
MTLKTDLETETKKIFASQWTTRNGNVVPDPDSVRLSNDAVEFERATVLYADLTGSTAMVDKSAWSTAAEIYKAYLYCAGRIINNSGGSITSYDGDRVMAVFIGDSQSSNAAKCALKINYAVQHIVSPAMKKQYPHRDAISQVVGIDTSKIRVARTGVRGGNDLVWVGRAANYAAKLTEIKMKQRTWITESVYNKLSEESKYGGQPKKSMWEEHTWNSHDKSKIYGSTWWWAFE